MRLAATLLCIAISTAALGQHADPLQSHQCRAARAELESALDEAATAHNPRAHRLAAARKAAGDVCLGTATAGAQRSGAPEPPRIVPPPLTFIAPRPGLPPVADLPRPPVQIARPATITACDPAGCWDTEGRRLNQMGPSLMGPKGICSLQAGVVVCP